MIDIRVQINSIHMVVLHTILILCLCCGSGAAQVDRARNVTVNQAGPAESNGFVGAVEKTVALEIRENENWKTRQKETENEIRGLGFALNAYRIQVSAYNNMLHTPQIPIADLERAWVENGIALRELNQKIPSTKEQIESLQLAFAQVSEQIQDNRTQLREFAGNTQRDSSVEEIQKNLNAVIGLLEERKLRIQKILDRMTEQETQLGELVQTMSSLSGRMEEQIRNRKKQEMFQRKDSPLRSLSLDMIRRDVEAFGGRIRSLASPAFWVDNFQPLWSSGFYSALLAAAGFLGILVLAVRFRKAGDRVAASWGAACCVWRSLGYTVLRRSLIWVGGIGYLYIFMEVRNAWIRLPVLGMVFYGLILFLFTRWAEEARRSWNQVMPHPIPENPLRMLGILITFCFIAGCLLIPGEWLLLPENILLVFLRIGIELGLILWMAAFVRSWDHPGVRFVSGLGYAVFGLPLLLEVTGFGYMAVYWMISVGKTLIAGLWIGLLYFVIREWEQTGQSDEPEKGVFSKGHSWRWMGFRFLWIGWAVGSLILLFICWGAKKTVALHVIKVLNYSVPIGDIRFSLLSLFYALVAVGLTLLTTRFWRSVLKNRLFSSSGLDSGLQDSIATLSTYVIWALGIFIALRVVGVSATSLTVVFGALSIGLGFGLQNIFNNFISGIILLFERPIQIGDAVEINGIWGVVQQINFRSTLVRTYDNASLIIPNSEFISNQVTNWSFKDQRLRRVVSIGVAYGTDVRMTADLLLEVARSCPWVLSDPKPDVLFSDFADSALMFKLRFWTLLDHIPAAENDIRYRIHEVFAKHNIEIPFPQQDVHIRSTPAGVGNE